MDNIVEDLLRQKNVVYRISGQDYLVGCLNPDHEDSNPSMRIDKVDGKFHCLACGFKGNIFKYYGILTNHTSIRVSKLKEKLKELNLNIYLKFLLIVILINSLRILTTITFKMN